MPPPVSTDPHAQPDASADPGAVPEPPRSWRRLLGPVIILIGNAPGSGELLFISRVGALYGYAVPWALIAAAALLDVANIPGGNP